MHLQITGGNRTGLPADPLPGTIVAVHVATGQQVARGMPLVTVEAMKMEHTLTAPYDGVVSRIAYGCNRPGAGGRYLGGAVAPLRNRVDQGDLRVRCHFQYR